MQGSGSHPTLNLDFSNLLIPTAKCHVLDLISLMSYNVVKRCKWVNDARLFDW